MMEGRTLVKPRLEKLPEVSYSKPNLKYGFQIGQKHVTYNIFIILLC
jgi:hypothetical protein